MANMERTRFLGHLKEKEITAEDMKLRMASLRDDIRAVLDPYLPLDAMKLNVASVKLDALVDIQSDYSVLMAEIADLREMLGK